MAEQLERPRGVRPPGPVDEFFETREPVASQRLAAGCARGLSPATVRCILARLEEAGYLHKPHTSAGRVPTDRAYRYFAERVLSQAEQEGDPDWAEVERLGAEGSLNGVARRVSNTLARSVHALGFAVTPSASEVRLRSCELVPSVPTGCCGWSFPGGAGARAVLRTRGTLHPRRAPLVQQLPERDLRGLVLLRDPPPPPSQVGSRGGGCRREVRQALGLVAPYFMGQAPGGSSSGTARRGSWKPRSSRRTSLPSGACWNRSRENPSSWTSWTPDSSDGRAMPGDAGGPGGRLARPRRRVGSPWCLRPSAPSRRVTASWESSALRRCATTRPSPWCAGWRGSPPCASARL